MKCIKLFVFLFITALPFSFTYAADTLQDRYLYGAPIKILIVPGHDDKSSGTQFKDTREADLTIALAKKIAAELSKDPALQVTMTRDGGWYTPEVSDFLEENESKIKRFVAARKKQMNRMFDNGKVELTDQVTHATAADDVAFRLYGINVWADKQKFDFVIHVHFNDYYPRKSSGGEFSGYSVYVPEHGLLNSASSLPLGRAIASRLNTVVHPTNAPSETKKSDDVGVIHDLKLIALGANRTLVTPSILVEYSYIYEPNIAQFFEESSNVFAYATVLGIRDYIRGASDTQKPFSYEWDSDLKKTKEENVDTLMLQYALKNMGMFQSLPETCARPAIDGVYGDCTVEAVKAFQKQYGFTTDGIIGKNTRSLLNMLFSKFTTVNTSEASL